MKTLALAPPENKTAHRRPPSWEIVLISLLVAAVEARDRRIEWFEREDERKAAKLDRQPREGVGRRRAA